MKTNVTIEDATREWVNQFNAIPYGVCEKLLKLDCDGFTEVTVPTVGDRVYVYEPSPKGEYYGQIVKYDEENEVYEVEYDDNHIASLEQDEFEVERDDYLPMWGTLWTVSDSADEYWLSDLDGIRDLSECGFRVYEQDDFGYIFGIDGCGYSFFEAHWIPLYKKRGLQWHDERTLIKDEDLKNDLLYIIGQENIELVEKIFELYVGEPLMVGGFFGPLPKGLIKWVSQSQKFSVSERSEKVLDMNGYVDNDYYVITREVR